MEKTYNVQFTQPFNIVISGSSNTGKSEWVLKLIENASTMISPPVDLIIYCYKEFQARFKRVKGVIFHEGFDESLVSKEKLQNRSVLLILDDLMTSIKSDVLLNIFLVMSHHRRVNPVYICHNLYYSELKCMRTISLNTTYNVIMKNPRDKSSIECLGRQMFPGDSRWFMESYNHACSLNLFSYLVIDSKSTTPDEIRLRTNIWPGQDTICYVSNKMK